MRRDLINNVKIVEPPLGELSKRRGGFGRTCLTGCGCIVFLIVAAIVGLKIFVGPGPQSLSAVPPEFPKDIPIYDKDAIEQITFISGKYKNRGIEIAAFFPKLILSPLLLKLDDNLPTENSSSTPDLINKQSNTVRNLWRVITTPVGDHRDSVQIEWKNLEADPSFVTDYYKIELIKQDFKIDVESEGRDVRQFSFSRQNDGISGSFYAKGDENIKSGTDYIILTVNLPAK